MSTKKRSNIIEAVLNFWFTAPDRDEYGSERAVWFEKDPRFDAEIKNRFESVLQAAPGGELDLMAKSPEGAVAAILVLDQFPRNIYRNDARAFATDAHALKIARQTLDLGYDQQVMTIMRKFLYLPFEHSESLVDQNQALKLFATLGGKDLEYAERHHAIIARFGRFPHRNAALGRTSTAAEIEFLNQPGSSF